MDIISPINFFNVLCFLIPLHSVGSRATYMMIIRFEVEKQLQVS